MKSILRHKFSSKPCVFVWLLAIGLFLFVPACLAKEGDRKVLAVADKLETGDPYRFDEIKKSYERTAKIVLQHYKQDNPIKGSDPEIVFFLEDKPISEIFQKVLSSNALAVLGFKRTPHAKIALEMAQKHKITLISPVTPLDEAISSDYARGFGLPINRAVKIIEEFGTTFKKKFIVISKDVPLANRFDAAISKDFERISYVGEFPQDSFQKIDQGALIFFPGYAYEHLDSVKLALKNGKSFTIIGSTPWSYSEALLGRYSIACDIFAVSEFYNRATSDKVFEKEDLIVRKKAIRFIEDYKKLYGEKPETSAYAFYDSMYLSLRTIYEEKAGTREEFYQKISQSELWGVGGQIKFDKGRSLRKGYLLKWDKTRFEPVREFSP